MAQPSGTIYLMKNVPLLPSYEHTIDFKDKSEQHSYFMGFVAHTLERYQYIRKEREYITVEMTMNELDSFNYLMFRSESDGRLYYAFIMNKTYLNPNTTTVFFEIDVIQTYMFDYKWQPSYISKAHVDRWNAQKKPIYSLTEEGLDYGSEYSVESAFRIEQDNPEVKWLLVSSVSYSAIASSGAIVQPGTIGVAPSTFISLLVPFSTKRKSDGYYKQFYIQNEQIDVLNYDGLIGLLFQTSLGEYLRSITLLSYNPYFTVTAAGENFLLSPNNGVEYGIVNFSGQDASHIGMIVLKNIDNAYFNTGNLLAETDWTTGIENGLPTDKEWEEVKTKPFTTPRDKRFESKLLCAPYRYNLITDWRNAPVIYKNEYMSTDKIEILFTHALSTNAPFRYWLKGYKKDPEGRITSLTQTMGLDFPIISDAYYSYMLNNKNTIQANLTNAMLSAGTSILSGAVSGGVGGAIMGGIGGAVSIAQQQISENAKQQDLRAKPDTVLNSNDSTFNINDNNTFINFYRMKICCENEEIISNLFHMYGYKVNRLETPNTRSRTRFNYIKTIGANITGSINQNDLLTIKGIFDNGITIWHYRDKDFNYLDYQYENMEVILV